MRNVRTKSKTKNHFKGFHALLAWSRGQQPVDYVLLGMFLVLLGFGLAMLSSASTVDAYRRFGNAYYFFWRQMTRGFLPGAFLMFVLAHINYKKWEKYTIKFFIAAVILLVLVFIPGIGSRNNTDAVSWVTFGRWISVAHITFQPTEIVKLLLILSLAGWFAYRGPALNSDFWNGLVPFGVMVGLIALLVLLQPDVGTLVVLVTIAMVMYFVAGARWSHFVGLIIAGLMGMAGLIIAAPYRAARFMTFLHPDLDPQGIGYHVNQALLAVGSGGFFGLGFGQSRQKFAYLPEVMGDSIFAIIAEELGFIFAVALVVLFVLLAFRSLRLAKNLPDDFGRLVISGIVGWFMFQTFYNIAAMIGLMPLTGIPLPFISYGGTALMAAMAAAGILLNISRYSRV